MAISNYTLTDVQTFQAGVDMAGMVGRFVKITGANLVEPNDSLVIVSDGVVVSVEGAGIGADIGVMTTSGRKVPVVANAAITAGANVASLAADGKGLTAVGTGTVIQGKALDAAGAQNDIVTLLFGYKGLVLA